MATPVGHGLLGLAGAQWAALYSTVPKWRLYAFAVFATNAPDLDILVGLFAGDVNLFHQGPSHSLFAAILFGGLGIFCSRWLGLARATAFMYATLSYASHLLLDYFCQDKRAPFGQPLLWPLIDDHWIASQPLFSGVKHGVPGDSIFTVLSEIFSLANLQAIAQETYWFAPVLLVAWAGCSMWRRAGKTN